MSKEAMQQALEALQWIKSGMGCADIDATISTLSQAIEQAEKQEPVAWVDVHDYTNLYYRKPAQVDVVPLYYGLATPPAAPVQYELSPTDIYDFAGWLTTRKGVMKVGSSCEAGPMAEAVGEYLKTFPDRFTAAQRQWVGLTDDTIYAAAEVAWRAGWAACRDAEFVGEEAEDEAWGYQGATVAHDTEAKLKEKNT